LFLAACQRIKSVSSNVSKSPSIDGVIVIHKPVGPTSHDVVVCARRALGISRIGHTGTLDPQASGVLPLVLGQATRLAQHLTGTDKEYLATLRFGVTSDTYDSSGELTVHAAPVPTADEIALALDRFRGTFEQTPPLYSAKMVGGERSYVRARAGKPVQPPAVMVTTHAIELLGVAEGRAQMRVRCSAGFYVRSLAHDAGRALGCGALLDALVRTEAAGFRLEEAVPFEVLVSEGREALRTRVRPMEALLGDLPAVTLTAEGVRWARHGRDLGPRDLVRPLTDIPALVRMTAPDGRMLGLAEPAKVRGLLHPAVVFSYN
jgi:tRNA pseudouridine55 synthase